MTAGATPFAFAKALHDAVKARLRADSDFTKVRVELVGTADIGLAAEALVFIRPEGKIEGEQTWAALGRQAREDSFSLPCRLVAHATGSRNTPTLERAFERAQDILNEVVVQLVGAKPSSGSGAQTLDAHVEQISFEPFLKEGGWAVVCDFSVAYTARVV